MSLVQFLLILLGMTKKYQIFISSTFEDLKEERRAVTEAILNMGHIPVGMELFQASDVDQWTYITRRLQMVDYYVVIVAERYGSIDPDTGASFTEKEYSFAVEHGIPVIALLLSNEGRKARKSEHVEFERRTEIESFRLMCSKKMRKEWSNIGELASLAILALNELFATTPRPGLVPAAEALGAIVAEEIAHLSEENRRLKLKISESAHDPQSQSVAEIIDALMNTTLKEFCDARKMYPVRLKLEADGLGGRKEIFDGEMEVPAVPLLYMMLRLYDQAPGGFESSRMASLFTVIFAKQEVINWGWKIDSKLETSRSLGATRLLEGFVRLGLLKSEVGERKVTARRMFDLDGHLKSETFVRYVLTELARVILAKALPPKTLLLGL